MTPRHLNMKIDRLPENEWFALTVDSKLFHLGNCGDYDAAEEVAQDALAEENIMWLIDGTLAQAWIKTLQQGLGQANAT